MAQSIVNPSQIRIIIALATQLTGFLSSIAFRARALQSIKTDCGINLIAKQYLPVLAQDHQNNQLRVRNQELDQ